MTNREPVEQDEAVLSARRVVGLYGDPDVTWSVLLAIDFATPRDRDAVASAAADLVATHPALGAVPVLVLDQDEAVVLTDFADRPYRDREPLVRVALTRADRTLVVAAHHGVLDGLGLLGAAAVLAGVDLTSSARGIERTAEPTSFVRGSLRRLAEALVAPPQRLRGVRDRDATGDWVVSRDVVAPRVSSAALVAAGAGLLRRWNGIERLPANRRLIVSMGLSRRPGDPVPVPVRDTAYMRVDAGKVHTTSEAASLVRATAPEPAFPVTDGGGVGPRVTRLLAPRLGATLLVSNLGLVRGAEVLRVRFWPVPTGPYGVCLGLASAEGAGASAACSVTVRARRGWFDEAAADGLADLAAAQLVALAQ